MPPLEEIPEPVRGRSLVMIDGAVQGEEAVIEPLRALGPGSGSPLAGVELRQVGVALRRVRHYLNFAEEPVEVSLACGAPTLERLRAVKDRIDPENVLHASHAI